MGVVACLGGGESGRMLGCCGIGEGGQAETFTGVCGTGGKLGQTGRTVEAQVACMVCVKGGGVLRGGGAHGQVCPSLTQTLSQLWWLMHWLDALLRLHTVCMAPTHIAGLSSPPPPLLVTLQ